MPPLDDADKAFISELLAKTTVSPEKLAEFGKDVLKQANNGANAAILAKFEKFDLAGAVGSALEEAEKKRIEAGGKPAGGGGAPESKQVDPEFLKLRTELESVKKQSAEEKSKREAAEARDRTNAAHAKVKDALVAAKINPAALPVLFRALASEITYDENNNPLLPLTEGSDQTTSIDAAIKERAKAKDWSLFIAPPTNGGAGDKGRGATPPAVLANGKPDRDAIAGRLMGLND